MFGRLPPLTMASFPCTIVALSLAISLLLPSSMLPCAANFNQDFDLAWGEGRAKILTDGELLSLSLDKVSGSGFQSKNEYLFGKIDMQLKLVPGNSAGTVTAYYLSSQGPTHDEIDFEFLGNLSGDPYTLHTNVYSQGKGDREQQFRLWFDPSADFHTYSILCFSFFVDGTPVREFKNMEATGIPYPKNQAMRLYSSIWNADQWATRGGLVKTDWTQAPFTTLYRNFRADACIWSSSSRATSCGSLASGSNPWLSLELGPGWARSQKMPQVGNARVEERELGGGDERVLDHGFEVGKRSKILLTASWFPAAAAA